MKIEELIAELFKIGLIISVTILIIGLLIISLNNSLNIFQSTITLKGLFYGNPIAIITFSILVLMSLPIISILSLLIFYLKKKNKFFIIITSYVLLLLILTIFLFMIHVL
jgi:uncharacterized membrane protein